MQAEQPAADQLPPPVTRNPLETIPPASLPDVRSRPVATALGPAWLSYSGRPPRIGDDRRRIMAAASSKELNSPLFLPCSRPKQRMGTCRPLPRSQTFFKGIPWQSRSLLWWVRTRAGSARRPYRATLLDYFSANNIPTRAFDTELPRGTLKRFHPDITEIVDMTTTADQMKIFDTLSAGPSVTVIDVRAGLMSPTLASLRDIGFLDAAKAGQITFAVFHILGPSIASLDEIAETANFMQGAKYFLVKNFINDTQFFEWDQATYNSYFHRIKDATDLVIPKLNEMAYEQVELSSVPFLKFVANKGKDDEAANYSFVLRGYVRHWLANVWSEFDRIKLTDLVGAGKAVVRGSEK